MMLVTMGFGKRSLAPGEVVMYENVDVQVDTARITVDIAVETEPSINVRVVRTPVVTVEVED